MLHRANFRDHRKSLIIDGRVAFTGGAGLGDQWLAGQRSRGVARHPGGAVRARRTGPAERLRAELAGVLPAKSARHLLVLPGASPRRRCQGADDSELAIDGCRGGRARMASHGAPMRQTRTVHREPVHRFRCPGDRGAGGGAETGSRREGDAAGRHMDTGLLRSTACAATASCSRRASRSTYCATFLHQKTMIVDGVWATVGTANFDNRSFALNQRDQPVRARSRGRRGAASFFASPISGASNTQPNQ